LTHRVRYFSSAVTAFLQLLSSERRRGISPRLSQLTQASLFFAP